MSINKNMVINLFLLYNQPNIYRIQSECKFKLTLTKKKLLYTILSKTAKTDKKNVNHQKQSTNTCETLINHQFYTTFLTE